MTTIRTNITNRLLAGEDLDEIAEDLRLDVIDAEDGREDAIAKCDDEIGGVL